MVDWNEVVNRLKKQFGPLLAICCYAICDHECGPHSAKAPRRHRADFCRDFVRVLSEANYAAHRLCRDKGI
eukprot:2441329-Pyramimonas_sp.AAC.1